MNIREISASETLELRNEVLRPGCAIAECTFEGDNDEDSRHFGVVDEAQDIVGVVSVYRRNNIALEMDGSYQIRAMATKECVRGMGLGRLLLDAAEKFVASRGRNHVWANARSSALGFYRHAGYIVASDEFVIDNIGPHFLVIKSIA